MRLNLYVLFQYTLCLVGTALFLFNAHLFSMPQKAAIATLISIVVINSGVLFEQRPWAKYSEWLRIILYPLLLMVLCSMYGWSPWIYFLALLYLVASVLWFYSIQRTHVQIPVA